MIWDEMVGWHHQLNGHEFQYTHGGAGGKGALWLGHFSFSQFYSCQGNIDVES